MNYNERDGLNDYGRKIQRLVKQELLNLGRQEIEWRMERQTAEIPHPRVAVRVGNSFRGFQIDEEEQALGTSDEALSKLIRDHLLFALEENP